MVHITVIKSVLTLMVPTPALVTVDSHLVLMDSHVLVCVTLSIQHWMFVLLLCAL